MPCEARIKGRRKGRVRKSSRAALLALAWTLSPRIKAVIKLAMRFFMATSF
jgi:hypothetical protein